MEEFIKEQTKFNAEISSELQKMKSDAIEHGKRLNAFEKEINTMTGKFEKMSSMMEKMNDKLDNHTESINDIKVQFPTFMNEFVEKNAKRTEEIVSVHQVKCSADLGNKFIMMPEGWKGNAVRIGLVLLACVFGLDLSELLPIVPRNPTVEIPSIQRHVNHSQTSITLKDNFGNTYYLKPELATDSHK